MILTCPECATKYEVDGALIPVQGREVRCSACLNIWHTGDMDLPYSAPEPTVPNLAQLDMTARNVSHNRTPGREYSYTSGAYFAKPSGRTQAAAMRAEIIEPEIDDIDVERDRSVRAALFDVEHQHSDIIEIEPIEPETIEPTTIEGACPEAAVAAAQEPATLAADVETKWVNVRDAIENLSRQKETMRPSQRDQLSDEGLKAQDEIDTMSLDSGNVQSLADEGAVDIPHVAKMDSPFHAELEVLQSALQKAGFTIAPLTEQNTDSAEDQDTETGIDLYQNTGDVITVEGDVTTDQLSRQYKETKKSASHFVKTFRRLVSLFWRYTPPIFKNKTAGAVAAEEQLLRLPELSRVTDFRQKIRQKAKNKITPLRAIGWLGWVGSAGVMAYATVTYKDKIIEVLPGSATFYYLAGFDKPASPLQLDSVAHRYAMSTQGAVVEITGAIRNTSSRTIQAPQIEAQALGRHGTVLETWIIDVPVSQMSPQMETTFLARAKAPAGIEKITLNPIEPDEGARDFITFTAPGTEGEFYIENTMGPGWPAPNAPNAPKAPVSSAGEGLPILE